MKRIYRRNRFSCWINPKKYIYGNSNIKAIRIPDTVEVIQPFTFSGFQKVEKVKLSKSLAVMEQYIFAGCKNLKTFVVPGDLKRIDPDALKDCSGLTTIRLSGKNKKYQVKNNCLMTIGLMRTDISN